MSALLIDGRFVAVFPRLVRALGGDVTAAAVLQAVHYRMQALGRKGELWMPMFLSEIAEEIGISHDQAQRAGRRLRDAGLLLTRGSRGSIREWSIDYEAIINLEQGDAESRYSEATRNRVTSDAESRQGDAESHHHRREIALPSFLLEDKEHKEIEERSPMRKPVNDRDPQFEKFWTSYPRKSSKGTARRAWSKAILKADPEQIIYAAEQYANDPNREAAFTAHAATWLNGERWLDDPLPAKDSRADRKISEVETMIRRAAERDARKEIGA